ERSQSLFPSPSRQMTHISHKPNASEVLLPLLELSEYPAKTYSPDIVFAAPYIWSPFVPPKDRSQILSPFEDTQTTHASHDPILTAVLLPSAGEKEPPPIK